MYRRALPAGVIAVLGTSVLLHIPNISCPTRWRCVFGNPRWRIWWRHCILSIFFASWIYMSQVVVQNKRRCRQWWIMRFSVTAWI